MNANLHRRHDCGPVARFCLGPSLMLACLCLMPASLLAQSYFNFEGKQTNPICLSPDGTRLFAVNTPDARVSVFDLTDPAAPRLVAEIPVGIEPVSVNARTQDEVWVVNEVSDSVSVVSIAEGLVLDTLHTPDEPMDVAFAAGYAFVSLGRSNAVAVFDVATRKRLKVIEIFGHNPRALAISRDGKKVYVACALAGNGTTLVPRHDAPAPPAPTNPALPAAPHTSLIVDADDPQWHHVIDYQVADVGVVEIDTATLEVTSHFEDIGTVNLGLAVHPVTGDLYVANTDARNLVRFEPMVRGYFQFNRVSRVDPQDGEVTSYDLNPEVDYGLIPNESARATALAQPAGMVFDPTGSVLYVAAYGTDRIARVDAGGNVLHRFELSESAVDSKSKRGPRGLALHAESGVLFTLNRISNTISLIDTQTDTLLDEIPVGRFDPTPQLVREGRGFLYDAKLSGNGTVSCASCHVDAEMDMLAWDLGNPEGEMQTLNVILIDGSPGQDDIHPMKGPMTTQTLRGLKGLNPLHWRGDRPTFRHFNPAFDSLMGGTPLSESDMDRYEQFINSILFAPNPNRNLDDTLPAQLGPGRPARGESTFSSFRFSGPFTCALCHDAKAGTTTVGIADAATLRGPQPFDVPHFRNLYQKVHFNNEPGAMSLLGFGFNHDGEWATLDQAHTEPRFGILRDDTIRKDDLGAFLLCFDTGIPPAVGYAFTVTSANVDDPSIVKDWDLLLDQESKDKIDLIAHGRIDGMRMGLIFAGRNKYQTSYLSVRAISHPDLMQKVREGGILTIMGVPRGAGKRIALDRDEDGILDGDEL